MVEFIRPTVKHELCKHECQQAKDYGVWPEHTCSPVCVYLGIDSHLQDGQKFDKGGLVEQCPWCKGTGMVDSGGTHPWGEAALIPCECQKPIDDEEL